MRVIAPEEGIHICACSGEDEHATEVVRQWGYDHGYTADDVRMRRLNNVTWLELKDGATIRD